jgi:hypothetical protein
MAQLNRAVATLRVMGDDLIPNEVSVLLGAQPTAAQVKGQEIPTKSASGFRIARSGLWRLRTVDTSPEDVDGQVNELLSKLTSDLAVWRDLSRRFRIDLFCGWFMSSSNEGLNISPQTLQALGERGIELALDIYGPDTAA